MKKLSIAVAILAAVGSSVAHANVTGASTTLTKNISQECNIGLWAVGQDGSVGDPVSEVGNDYVHSELNDFKTSGQQITGKAKCNASGGYDVHVTATNGTLSNFDAQTPQVVEYVMNKVSSSSNFDDSYFGTDVDLDGGVPVQVGKGNDTDVATFKLKMSLPTGVDFTYAGQYTETLTFDLTPL